MSVPAQFFVYTHARPDGSVFYVGKGTRRRAFDLSPTRRKRRHRSIIKSYGRDAILITLYPAVSELDAFEHERQLIAEMRAVGIALINETDGGEGCSGRPLTERQAAALAKGRGRDRKLSDEARASITDGLARGRLKAGAWRASPEGQAHIRMLGHASARATRERLGRPAVCEHCGSEWLTKSMKPVRFCSKACDQRWRRAAMKAERCGPDGASTVPGSAGVSV
ncbi:putative Zn-ribbon and HTH transcriptional regulator [Methylobacterium fujisawaense]|uniref:Zn-ribbon and HTH transcriptional regulator n=1 Tax=Methylobacterium fujisawaense TaxID=107400 RepID=A0ABR6DBF8_9HYPH|nr:hypothetical protein [Methylobacterium fujisawaense]MBA9063123.1 putative Zn-ribbon and HTH transcriptional regulator [Methylobacterium fujisawaense]